ncbi:MAG TPA: GNAT family N-acetyltransferase [Acidimicrobiales bacterium]|nr:GNAT family N-acetyltransferase [Acidimicrobiales bacterium]
MARQRLGVVLLVPQPVATQIDGLRRALGSGALGRIDPHITLVPPINVAERDLPAALATVRQAAAASRPLALRLGPVATFAPVNPVAYLAVGGAPDALDALHSLRRGLRSGVLDRPDPHDFVPHATVADELAAGRIEGAVRALADFAAEVSIERVHVLAEQPGRVWVPIADAPLGGAGGVVGRGSLPLELTVSGRPDLEAAALLAVDQESPGLPFAVTARRDGAVIAAGWGWTARHRLELADVVVASQHRGEGVGRHVLAAVEDLAARRGCTHVGTSAPRTGAAAALLRAAGWSPAGDPGEAGATPGSARWERALRSTDSA